MKHKQVFSMNLTGPIDYGFRNDYMFRAALQLSQKALIGLISSLLHLPPSAIKSVTITNPITLGATIEDKDFVLDTNVLLNNNTLINLEMQVNNLYNWPERSLSYLCRNFDQLNKGQNYSELKPVIHIGFLDYTLFPEHPEFYATYRLLNLKDHFEYSDKLTLSVVDLKHIELATDADKAYGIDKWAALFRSISWEEILMTAKNDEYLMEATKTLYNLNADDMVRQRCQARMDAELQEQYLLKKIDTLTAENAAKDAEIESLKKELASLQQNEILFCLRREFLSQYIPQSTCHAYGGISTADDTYHQRQCKITDTGHTPDVQSTYHYQGGKGGK